MAPQAGKPSQQEILEAYWSLIAQGLAYVDLTQPAPENWCLNLSRAGAAAAVDEQANPDDPAGYIASLYKGVPDVDPLVRLYANEAVRAYTSRCYLSCTTMLGVAAEACFLQVAESFVEWRGAHKADSLNKRLADPRVGYIHKFLEFRKRLDQEKQSLPAELRDALDILLGSVLDLLRVSRNDAGHPTGKEFHREDCFTALRVFERLARRMYELRRFFEEDKRGKT